MVLVVVEIFFSIIISLGFWIARMMENLSEEVILATLMMIFAMVEIIDDEDKRTVTNYGPENLKKVQAKKLVKSKK